jgi:hypothetical protein
MQYCTMVLFFVYPELFLNLLTIISCLAPTIFSDLGLTGNTTSLLATGMEIHSHICQILTDKHVVTTQVL